MMADLKDTPSQLVNSFSELPTQRKLFVVFVVLLTISILIGLIMWAQRIQYRTLYSGLSSEDAGAVVNKLTEMKVPYRAGAGGSVMVPAGSVYELRMKMAGEGLPQSSVIGYEIFDRQNLGVTEFIQRVNFLRALQGELVRTINQFAEIRSSRVHLTLPKKTLFIDDQEKPRASVVLHFAGGKILRGSQVHGIVHLVASSVEGLSPDDVIVVDSHGKLLAGGEDKAQAGGVSLSQQELLAKTERKIERKIESMLAEVVGHDKITAKVSVAMDFTRIEQTEERFDPDAAVVRSEQRSSEKSSGKRPVASGIPGVVSNTPGLEEQAGGAGGVRTVNYDKSDETVNYEISRITKTIINPVGTIERLTVAVLVDGTYTSAKDENGNQIRQYIPRAAEEMNKYEVLVKKAVGFDEDRGDSIEVVNVQFAEVVFERETTAERLLQGIDWQSVITYLITALLFVLFFVFGLKPLLGMLSKAVMEGGVAGRLPVGRKEVGGLPSEELPPGLGLDGATKLSEKENQLLNFAQSNPKLFAQYIKSWLR